MASAATLASAVERGIEAVQPRGVRRGDPAALLARHALQDALEDQPRARERRFGVRIVGAPEQPVDPDHRAVADAHGIFLEAQEHVPAEEVARREIGRAYV